MKITQSQEWKLYSALEEKMRTEADGDIAKVFANEKRFAKMVRDHKDELKKEMANAMSEAFKKVFAEDVEFSSDWLKYSETQNWIDIMFCPTIGGKTYTQIIRDFGKSVDKEFKNVCLDIELADKKTANEILEQYRILETQKAEINRYQDAIDRFLTKCKLDREENEDENQ